MSRFSNWRRTFALAVVLLLAGAGMAAAQEQQGSLYGTCKDTQGAALPGVTVQITGLGAPQIQVTNAQGQFRFLNLDPGVYHLTASLEGFSTVEYKQVNIQVGRSTTLEITLSPAVEEVITVTSESPLLDERKVSRGTTVSQIELEKIPTARDPWSIVTQTPGVLSDRINVGGNNSGQQAVFTAPGVSDNENSFAVDGVVITDMAAIGSSPTYYDFDQFQEIQVSTGGTDVEKISSGASLNLVTKRGSNNPRGSARFLETAARKQFDIFKQANRSISGDLENGDGNGGLNQQTLANYPGNGINEILDYGFEAGGPIVKDKLWVWGSYGRNDIKQFNAQGNPDNTLLENSAIKFNGQPAAANSIVASWNRGDKIKDGRTGTSGRSILSSWNQTGPTEIWKVEDTHVFSSNFYLTGLYSYVDGGFALQPKGGAFPGARTTDTATAIAQGESVLDPNGIWQNGWYGGFTDRNTDSYQVDGSYFFNTGNLNHELKFGASYRKFDVVSGFGWGGGRNIVNYTCESLGLCGVLTAAGYPGDDLATAVRGSGGPPAEQKYTAAWIQDTLTTGNWTINAGVRYDQQKGTNKSSMVQSNPVFSSILPALNYGGADAPFTWDTFSPRLGVTYALGAERKTLLRASYSRFAEQLSTTNITRLNPLGYAAITVAFNDVNGNNYFDVGEPYKLFDFGGFDINNPTSLTNPNVTDPSLKPSVTDELLAGVEHAFLPEFVVGLDLTYRNTSDILEAREFIIDGAGNKRVATRDDYQLYKTFSSDGVTIPNLPDGTPWSTSFYEYKPGISKAGGSYLTNGDSSVEYKGAGLTLTKRLSNRWMARGYFQYGKSNWSVGSQTLRYADPTPAADLSTKDGALYTVQSAGSGPYTDVLIQSTWSANINGLYQVAPDKPWGFNVAGNFFAREGYPLPYTYQTSVPGRGNINAAVVSSVDQYRASNVYTLDLRLEKDMPFSDNLSGILSLDAFNVTNANTVLQRDRSLNAATANYLTESLSPRIYRLGFRLNWR